MILVQIAGLKEGRPSVVMGDRVLCTRLGGSSEALEGFVHEVRREEVLLKFHHSVHQNFDRATTFRVEVRFGFCEKKEAVFVRLLCTSAFSCRSSSL